MRIASVRPNQLAIVRDGSLVLVGDLLVQDGVLPPGASMIDLIARYDSVKDSMSPAAERASVIEQDAKRLAPPVASPSKIWAAASNYRRGGTGLENAAGRGAAASASPEAILEMCFLKPPSAVIGPEEQIIIPEGAETIFPELELCAVIGREARNVSRERALDTVFGYTIMLDVTARGGEAPQGGLIATRCVRKGYDTFAPIGPWITTRDEIRDPQSLAMKLWVNGELRQSATTDGMINGVAELVSYLSRVGTLYPGDLITTGNPDAPAFQEKLVPGDKLTAEIEGIGNMNLYVGRG
jgi:2-keto-4-pentenoate hydratase/2-oxohepta-3-ene-1,7-dioic acid hydratase in catechol pathway